MANGAMTLITEERKNVREYMVNNSAVDCIVRLPDKLFLLPGFLPAYLY
jgi:type I restriction enzyme M protein